MQSKLFYPKPKVDSKCSVYSDENSQNADNLKVGAKSNYTTDIE
jgi:hypothetical protein